MGDLPLLFPPPLARGDTIGLVAPASPPAEEERIQVAIDRLVAQGFRVKPSPHLRERTGYLAGSDRQRADDLQAAFADPEVKGIIALRGGYGSCRILPLLDYDLVRAHPKIFLGYSDNTALHIALLEKARLVSYHGPNASEAFLPGNAEALFRRLTQVPASGETLFARATGEVRGLETVVPGQAQGRLLGGNMTCLLRLLGTPYAPDFHDAILFLEDVSEKAYRVDGLFTQLRLAGALAHVRGLVLGRFDHPDAAERARIEVCLRAEAERIGVPCVGSAPIGHFPEQVTLPHGVRVELDADQGSLRIA